MNNINELLEIAEKLETYNVDEIANFYGFRHKIVVSPSDKIIIKNTLLDWLSFEYYKVDCQKNKLDAINEEIYGNYTIDDLDCIYYSEGDNAFDVCD